MKKKALNLVDEVAVDVVSHCLKNNLTVPKSYVRIRRQWRQYGVTAAFPALAIIQERIINGGLLIGSLVCTR